RRVPALGGEVYAYMKGLEESHGPPRLDVEGARVRPDWLYDFLQAPTTLRPWVKLRMPTFHLSEEETTTLVRYFAAAGRVSYPFVRPEEETQAYAHERERERPGYYETARLAVTGEEFQCVKCHAVAGLSEGPGREWPLDLAIVRRKLRPEWLRRWLRNPWDIVPGAAMPEFDWGANHPTFMDGDTDAQVRAIADWLMRYETQRER
ncbi:MAG: c-type cytochrome, partial [Planctomycetes bacterium]|nr:c-type cytochrome [Planctomycetota bacterium]